MITRLEIRPHRWLALVFAAVGAAYAYLAAIDGRTSMAGVALGAALVAWVAGSARLVYEDSRLTLRRPPLRARTVVVTQETPCLRVRDKTGIAYRPMTLQVGELGRSIHVTFWFWRDLEVLEERISER